ncbi:hypothetical protein KI387_005169, partial [Taxus chinensis]
IDYGDDMEYLEDLVGMLLTNINDGMGLTVANLSKEKENKKVAVKARVSELEDLLNHLKE